MEMMNEKDRKKIILEAHKFGGISLRHQSLKVHKNGAKFPISRAYIDDELLDPEIKYTLVLIPEIKIASKTTVVLSFFKRKAGPVVFYSYPENSLNEKEIYRIANIMDQAFKEGFYIHQSSIISSLNYYFEIPSEWARGNKEMLMISVVLDTKITQTIEQIIRSIFEDFISGLKNNKELFKALYIEDTDSYSEEEHSNIKEISENLQSTINELYKKVIISIRDKKE